MAHTPHTYSWRCKSPACPVLILLPPPILLEVIQVFGTYPINQLTDLKYRVTVFQDQHGRPFRLWWLAFCSVLRWQRRSRGYHGGYALCSWCLRSSCTPLISLAVIIADIISTVEFDSTGNYLATGDKGGRVVLFERNEMVRKNSTRLSLSASCQEIKVPQEHLANTFWHYHTYALLFFSRKKDANTNFIQNFNRTSQNSIILNRSKSRRR